jgi:quercetin dioxygenase-like cupin family protein
MILSGHADTVTPGAGRIADLGIARMRLLAGGDATARSAFSVAEFTGGPGPWTVPHLHRGLEESFFVLDGDFTFTVGEEEIATEPGAFVVVPRGTRHLLAAGPAGGRCLVLWVPGGLEQMFLELAELGPDAIRNPSVRAAISAKYDSVPVSDGTTVVP